MKKLILFLLLFSSFAFAQNATKFTNVLVEGTFEVDGIITLADGITIGSDAFTTTAAADTVLLSGALATDIYFITGKGGSVDQQDVLQVEAKADTFIVHRLASGASGLTYNWLRFRKD